MCLNKENIVYREVLCLHKNENKSRYILIFFFFFFFFFFVDTIVMSLYCL